MSGSRATNTTSAGARTGGGADGDIPVGAPVAGKASGKSAVQKWAPVAVPVLGAAGTLAAIIVAIKLLPGAIAKTLFPFLPEEYQEPACMVSCACCSCCCVVAVLALVATKFM